MNDASWMLLLLGGVAVLGLLMSGARTREDARMRRRWDAAFDHQARRVSRTDATGVLRCRSCGASAPERAGRCPSCGAVL